ncbi:hypothetical protein UFOVP562_20 [uncultured Caudovirales phage]|uniref:Uncharacterized protein n=1 Tax=uncultured Caudovirales phage TaxID=2100421 RepID=A0A6J5MYS3_9CAUD|nr:hypothetical protein UFOVP562_20 [uncultured Caudovirales phage]
MKYVIERLQEASTWRGFILLLTSFGVGIAPEMITPIVTAGTGLAGLVGIFSKD